MFPGARRKSQTAKPKPAEPEAPKTLVGQQWNRFLDYWFPVKQNRGPYWQVIKHTSWFVGASAFIYLAGDKVDPEFWAPAFIGPTGPEGAADF
jgi:hypothetical protein